jgi:putative membrane protein
VIGLSDINFTPQQLFLFHVPAKRFLPVICRHIAPLSFGQQARRMPRRYSAIRAALGFNAHVLTGKLVLTFPGHPQVGRSMIKRYSDHAANERTFLAWVRTAIAMMAFGFVIERFDLFLQVAAPQLAGRQLGAHSQAFANVAGLAFIAIGVVMIVLAGFRFIRTTKDIDSEEDVPSAGERFDIALVTLVGLLGVALFLYLSRAVLPAI